jgi:uncharacterized protein YecE (DUF72 family)
MSKALSLRPPTVSAAAHAQLRVGTAGWAIPRATAEAFPQSGAGLVRYAARFNAVEINSTFYRAHRPSTYARWAAITPPEFRFSLKLPRRITHEARLIDCQQPLATFRAEALHLQDKLGPLLVQLPPSLDFSAATHEPFFATLRKIWPEAVVLEPRHPTWFDARAEAMLHAFQVGRVGADPARHPGADQPAGWGGVAYWRLHGSPRMYYSSYERATLVSLADRLASHEATEIWCVFDNTASGAAAANALELSTAL